MMATWRRVAVAGGVALLFPALAWAQSASPVGVVTTIQGQATVARLASTTALPLKFRDSVFERDKINTAENSIVKVLMGGKAVVTIRELSVLTITEDLGKTTINLESGKIAVSVARQLMRPGDRLEVHTPNAVAAVRGTVFVVEVNRQGAQLGGGNLAANTEVITVHGTVEVGSLTNPARTLVHAYQSLGITGGNVGKLGTVTPQQMTTVLAGLTTAALRGVNQDTSSALVSKEQTKVAKQEATSFVPLPSTPQVRQINNTGGCGGAPCGDSLKKLPPPPPPPPRPTPGIPGTGPPGNASGPNR